MMDQKQVKGFREYLKEYTILALVVAVITLFKLYDNLNTYIEHTLTEVLLKNQSVIERNTDMLNYKK